MFDTNSQFIQFGLARLGSVRFDSFWKSEFKTNENFSMCFVSFPLIFIDNSHITLHNDKNDDCRIKSISTTFNVCVHVDTLHSHSQI